MYRKSTPSDQLLAQLLDERDHVSIQLSLLGERAAPGAPELAALQAKVRELENRIESRRRPL